MTYNSQLLRIFLFIFSCLFSRLVYADNKDDSQCQASRKYLTELLRSNSSANVKKDFSCLTDIHSLEQKLSSFQLIDLRQNSMSQHASLKDAWVMPMRDLKNKLFLQKKSILLIDDGFSRINAAQNCAELKSAGFSSVKILVGGVNTWESYKRTTHEASYRIPMVSAQQLLFEYFNGQVVIVVSSKEIGEKLSALGFTEFFTLEKFDPQKITDIALTKTNNGFDPIVVIGDGKVLPDITLQLPNLYQLAGGVRAISAQIEQNIWANHNRVDAAIGGFCGAK